MTTQQSVDQTKTEAFLGKVHRDTSGLTTTIMASIGDRLGLFKQLAHAPATSAQLATRAAINERYARAWLGAMASAGNVEYDPASERFGQRDVSAGLPEQYDVITTFDVIHDAIDPRGLLRTIHQALRPDGRYVCLDINCAEHLEGNAGPLGSLFYGFSVLYCMTTSLSGHGEGLGTVGLPEGKLQELSREAGFSSVRRVPLENPFNNLYELQP